jgi:glycosyl transferase family 87
MPSSSVWTHRIAALSVGLGMAICAVTLPCWWTIVRDHSPSCSLSKPDFMSLYTGAKLFWTNRAALYNLEQQRLIQEPIDPSRGDWVLPFFYPPFFAAFLVPLSWLSFSLAFIVMTVINTALLATAIELLVRRLQLNRQQTYWLVLTTFCNYGVHYGLLEGQTSFIALLLLTLFVFGLHESRSGSAGIWSGFLFFKPQLAGIPLLILLSNKKWRELEWAFLILGLFALISLTSLGVDGVKEYLALSAQAAAGDDRLRIESEGMHNLRALTYFLFPAPWRDAVWWAGTIVLIALIVARSRTSEKPNGVFVTKWTTVTAALILVSPHLHSHDLTLLIIPFALVLKSAGEAVLPLVALTLVVVGVLPLVNTIAYPHLPPLLPIALLFFLAIDCWRERSRSTFLRMA